MRSEVSLPEIHLRAAPSTPLRALKPHFLEVSLRILRLTALYSMSRAKVTWHG